LREKRGSKKAKIYNLQAQVVVVKRLVQALVSVATANEEKDDNDEDTKEDDEEGVAMNY
jgi:hypothetical protein